MSHRSTRLACLLAASVSIASAGCGEGKEKTVVQLHYRLAPTKQLPPGMKTLAVLPAETTDEADAKWSELASNMVQGLLAQANDQFGCGLRFADRASIKRVLDEKDLTLSGIADGSMASSVAKLVAADGLVCSRIAVRIEKHRGVGKTLVLGGIPSAGSPNVHMKEVEKVSRNITVQCTFKLLDAATGQAWISYGGKALTQQDVGKPSPFFGSDTTEADMTPADQTIGQLVEREVRHFVGQIAPSEVTIDVPLRSSNDDNCVRGCKLASIGDYQPALEAFELALQTDPQDYRAAFGAGLMCERLGQYDQALEYYKKAILIKEEPEYQVAVKRVTDYKTRIWTE
jgi:tetratricopeptide (TPR) repeat protein